MDVALPAEPVMANAIDTRLSVLAALLSTLGLPVPPLEELRHAFGGDAPSAAQIVRYARRVGLYSHAMEIAGERLAAAPLPAIAVKHDGGFVLLLRAASDRVVLLQAQTHRPHVQPRAEFDAEWSGELIVIARPGSLRPARLAAAERTERWVEALALCVLALTILYVTVGLPGIDTADAEDSDHINPLNSQIWLGLLILGLPVLLRRWRATLALATANWALLALLAYFALSTTWALDPSASTRRLLFMLVQFTVLATAISGIRRSPSAHVIIAAVCATAALADLVWWIVAPGSAMAEDGFAGLRNQKNQTGLLMMYCCLASFPCVFLLRRRLWQCAMLAGTMVAAALLVATRSTTSQSVVILAALTMPLLLAVARLPRRVILAITAVALLLPAGALLVYLAWCGVAGQDPMLPLREVTVSDRTPIWEFVIGEIAKRPWLGAGYSSFWAIDPALQPSLKSGPSLGIFSMINEGHEGYLDLLVTGGIIGLVGGLFILLRAIVLAGRAVVSTRPPDQAWRDGDMARPTAIFHLAFLLGLVIHNFTESNLFTNSGLLAVALMLCLLDLEKWRLARRPAPIRRR